MSNTNRAVIFDLDGVLVNTAQFHKKAWYDLAEKEGYTMSDQFFRDTFGLTNQTIIPLLAGKNLPVEEINQMAEWKEQRYRQHIKGNLKLLDGVKPLIDDLENNGFLLAIGTSTPRANLDFMLDNIPIRDRFDALVAEEDITEGKPAPDTFLAAARKLSVPPVNCAVVEDAIPGVRASRAAGMATVAVTTTRSREELKDADLIVDSLAELTARDFVNLIDG